MKLLVVEDSVSSQFLIVECLQSQLELQNDEILIASNGSEAITTVEKHDIDIILMDLHMPVMNGLVAIKKLIAIKPQIKVIIITGSDDKFMIQETINSGASGYLFKENLAINLVPSIQNVINGYIVFPDPSLNRNSIFPSIDSKPSSKSDGISQINKVIATKIVYLWLNGEGDVKTDLKQEAFFNCFDAKPDRQNLINFLIKGNSVSCNLEEELKLRINKLVEKCSNQINAENIDRELDKIITQTDYWLYTDQTSSSFSSLKSRMEANAQILRIDYGQSIQKFIRPIFSSMPPKSCLEYLKFIKQLLQNEVKNLQDNLNDYQSKEKSASKAYNILLDNSEEIESLTRAILYIYRSKMLAESTILAIQVIQGLLRSIQLYIEDLILTIKVLNGVLDLLDISEMDDSITSFVHNKLKTFQDYTKMLQEIESEVGYPINNWGIRGIDSTEVKDKLLDKISSRSGDILENIEAELFV